MAVSKDILLEVIESDFSLLPEVPGKIEWLKIPGVRGRVTPFSYYHANIVSAAKLNSSDADATIHKVIEFFAKQQKAFSWIVGPLTTPADLSSRLITAGMTKTAEIAGMFLTNRNVSIRTNPAVRIREATDDDLMTMSRTAARAFPMPEKFALFFTESLFLVRDKLKTRMYLAFLDGTDEPVATSTMVYLPNQPIVRMAGASTIEEHRGKGIYTSLMARRLADAYKDGVEAAVIEAKRISSAPICKKIGFSEICGLEMYTWTPES